jgi:hypothetical protein
MIRNCYAQHGYDCTCLVRYLVHGYDGLDLVCKKINTATAMILQEKNTK